MSFICESCHHQTLPRVPQKQVVTERRTVVHTDTYRDDFGRKHTKETPGEQIVHTIKVCPTCATEHKKMGGQVI